MMINYEVMADKERGGTFINEKLRTFHLSSVCRDSALILLSLSGFSRNVTKIHDSQ